MSAQQSELQFTLAGEGRYQVGPHAATWQRRTNDEKIVDLSFRGKRFEVTREGSGPNGRPRMFINGIRTSDGKLFQGRSLLELVRKLDLHFDDFVEIPARLQRIERKLDALIGSRRVAKTKLCLVMVRATWTQERYIPKSALGGFSRVPLPVIHASQEMAAGEYRLLQSILFCAQGTGLLTAGKKRLARLAAVAETHVKHFLRSLHNRQIIRPTGRILKFGVREYELLTHPWFTIVDPEPIEGGQKASQGGQKAPERGTTLVPLKTSKENPTYKTSEKTPERVPCSHSNQPADVDVDKPTRLYCEEKLLGCLSVIVRLREIIGNEPMWRARIKASPKAIIKAIKKYHGLSEEKRKQIKNPAAWMTKQYRLFGGRSVAKTA